MKDLFFIPADWDIDTDAHSTVAALKAMPGYNHKRAQGWQLGDWGYNWSTISADFQLSAGEEYCLHFWLNGGENDRHDEVCELEIFGDDWNARQTFALNRNHTSYVTYRNGWYLFSICFVAKDDFVTMRFNAQRAVCSLLPASLTDIELAATEPADNIDETKPQRTNIVFRNGWPDEEHKLCSIHFGSKEIIITKEQMKIAALAVGGLILIFTLVKLIRKKKSKPKKRCLLFSR